MKSSIVNYFNAFKVSFKNLKKNLRKAYVANIDAKYAKVHNKKSLSK